MSSLQDFPRIPVTVTVVRDMKILLASGANQVVGFSGYRPLTNGENYTATLHTKSSDKICSHFEGLIDMPVSNQLKKCEAMD